jgi:plastocyanin
MTRSILASTGTIALCLLASACGGSGDAPNAPGDPAAPPPGAVVIDIIGVDGARSFRPNPATVPAGSTVVWHNVDSVTHRVVLDDRGLDTLNIGPGAFSAATTLAAAGPYHCSLHPEMVGTIAR